MAIKRRCPRCRQYLRPDGTCQNPNCVRYVPEPDGENGTNEETQEETE